MIITKYFLEGLPFYIVGEWFVLHIMKIIRLYQMFITFSFLIILLQYYGNEDLTYQLTEVKENFDKLEKSYLDEINTLSVIMNDLKRSYETEIKVLDSIIVEREQSYQYKLNQCTKDLDKMNRIFGSYL